MIKTIKVKKQLRLDELIKYVWENGIESTTFHSDKGGAVSFDMFGRFEVFGHTIISHASVFTVEVEESITEDTVFETLIEIEKDGDLFEWINVSIKLTKDGDSKRFYTLINGKLELIWEAK